MAGKRTILVGTVGHGVMRSEDDGETWGNTPITRGIHSDCLIRSMAQEPGRPEIIFAGSDKGLHRSEDGGASWTLLDTSLNGSMIWELAIDPVDPNIMYAGTGTPSTPGIYRSTDRGKTWEQRPMQIADSCPAVGIPRFTGIAVDPTDHKNVWAGIEVDGVRRSTDGGDTWTEVSGALNNLDSHDIAVTDGSPSTVISVGNDELFTSTDNGASWNPIGAKEKFQWPGDRVFPRGIAIKPGDPRHHLPGHRQRTYRRQRRRGAVTGRGQDLGEHAPARGSQLLHPHRRGAARRPVPGPGRQPVRLPVPQRRRRRQLEQAAA